VPGSQPGGHRIITGMPLKDNKEVNTKMKLSQILHILNEELNEGRPEYIPEKDRVAAIKLMASEYDKRSKTVRSHDVREIADEMLPLINQEIKDVKKQFDIKTLIIDYSKLFYLAKGFGFIKYFKKDSPNLTEILKLLPDETIAFIAKTDFENVKNIAKELEILTTVKGATKKQAADRLIEIAKK
jgi:hypothetical protein